MRVPAFFDDIEPIRTIDPLAALLGAAEHGRIDYDYVDAVKLAGHSCPTVAGAWLMTDQALRRLYPDSTPQRGGLRVDVRRAQDEKSTGVLAAVVSMLTGAAGDGGFLGLAGQHARRGLMRFGAPIDADLRFTRIDSGRAVDVRFHGDRVPMPVELKPLLAYATTPDMDAATIREFGQRWQAWVRSILVEHRDDPALVEVIDVDITPAAVAN